MEVQFDSDKRGANIPKTRIYAPTHKNYSVVELSEDETPAAQVKPQPVITEDEEPVLETPQKAPWPLSSKILLIASMFVVAATALFALKGSADIAQIHSEIADINEEISETEELISQIINDQSSLNDYTSINEANQDAGRVMTWSSGDGQ
ncbi:MAG: hypothetical protein Q4C04_07155 [Clostridia bacterium]|nr:hypothetical protein [Clostridia bacterium]